MAKPQFSVLLSMDVAEKVILLQSQSDRSTSSVFEELVSRGLDLLDTPKPRTADAPDGWAGPLSFWVPAEMLSLLNELTEAKGWTMPHLLWHLFKVGWNSEVEHIEGGTDERTGQDG